MKSSHNKGTYASLMKNSFLSSLPLVLMSAQEEIQLSSDRENTTTYGTLEQLHKLLQIIHVSMKFVHTA